MNELKRCSKCGEMKPRSEFWKRLTGRTVDGLRIHCKSCMRADCRARYLKHGKTARYKEQHRIRQQRYLATHPEVSTAHRLARNQQAILKKDACEQCGKRDCALHMHHPDHRKPLEIVTLCVPCHELAHHGELK